jgi:hypothetical protein
MVDNFSRVKNINDQLSPQTIEHQHIKVRQLAGCKALPIAEKMYLE